MSENLPDHGEFTLKASLNDDLKLIRRAEEMAKKNPVLPGQYGLRVVLKADTPQGKLEIIRLYHVDLNAGIVTITETIKGAEMARRTRKLEDLG